MNKKTLKLFFFIGSIGVLIFSLVTRHNELIFLVSGAPTPSIIMPSTSVSIKDKSLDIGKTPISSEASSEFVLYNLGPENLFIDRIEVSCTCTTGNVPVEAIFPGDSTIITVTTNKDSEGYFFTDVLVYGNFETSPEILSFEGYLVD